MSEIEPKKFPEEKQAPDAPPEEKSQESFNIRNGRFGFHFTVDSMLPDLLTHGLISRYEERRRGLDILKKHSRAPGDNIYFTTELSDLYVSDFEKHHLTTDEILEDLVGIAIKRPSFAYKQKAGHFAVEGSVQPDNFKALVFVDKTATRRQGSTAFDNYAYGDPLPKEKIKARVSHLRTISKQAGVNVPLCGVSGEVYYFPTSETEAQD